MFQRLDPRVRLLWWAAISVVAMVFRTTEATVVLVLPMYLGWQLAGMTDRFLKFTLRLIPFLLFISLISLFPTFDVERAIRMSLRYYTLLGSTSLILATTSYAELTTALRNFRHPRLSFLDRPLEVFAFVFGLAFSSVPFAAEEWQTLKETQRACGLDLDRGNKLQQVRCGLRMLQPLVLRIFKRIEYLFIAIIMYGYHPFKTRTHYRPLVLSRVDRRVASLIAATSAVGIALAFVLKV
jgi:energy-coupling factor transporter transmembrane protein EcfT